MRKWLPLITVCLGTFMLLIDVTIVNVALPDMAGDLKTSFGSLQWVVDAYALALAALVLGTGSIADRRRAPPRLRRRPGPVRGRRRWSAASRRTPALLIAARAVQGVGAAAMFATTFALLNSNYHGTRPRHGLRHVGRGGRAPSAAIGPILGGLLTEGISLALDLLREPAGQRARHRAVPDRARTTRTSRRAAAHRPRRHRHVHRRPRPLTYGLIRANEDGWASAGIVGLA